MHPIAFNTTLEEALNVVGMFVFAISGALLAVRKNYDIVGMAVLAEITAIGGGVLRDLMLGAVPPAAIIKKPVKPLRLEAMRIKGLALASARSLLRLL